MGNLEKPEYDPHEAGEQVKHWVMDAYLKGWNDCAESESSLEDSARGQVQPATPSTPSTSGGAPEDLVSEEAYTLLISSQPALYRSWLQSPNEEARRLNQILHDRVVNWIRAYQAFTNRDDAGLHRLDEEWRPNHLHRFEVALAGRHGCTYEGCYFTRNDSTGEIREERDEIRTDRS